MGCPSLLTIPLEVTWEIADALPKLKDVSSLCLVNKQLYHTVEHRLYRRDAQSSCPASLRWAAITGRLGTARKGLLAGVAINGLCTKLRHKASPPLSSGFCFRTALAVAIITDQAEVATFFLQNGADPGRYVHKCHVPLHIAAGKGLADIMALCIQKSRTEINMPNRDGATPLMLALRGNHQKAVRFLLEQHDIIASTPLTEGFDNVTYVCQAGNLGFLRLLLRRAETIPIQHLVNALLEVCKIQKFKQELFVKLLLQTPIPASALCMALARVCGRERLDLARHILDAGHDLTNFSWTRSQKRFGDIRMDQNLIPPVHAACETGQLASLQLLHCHGFHLDAPDGDGLHPLHYACKTNNMVIVDFLLSKGVKPDVTFANSQDCLDIAVKYDRQGMFERFIELGLDPQRRRGNGETLLHRACKSHTLSMVERVFGLNVPVDVEDNNGMTAFQTLIRYQLPGNNRGERATVHEKVVGLFAAHETAETTRLLTTAVERESKLLVQLVLRHLGTHGQSELNDLLHKACAQKSIQRMRLLVECGAKMTDADAQGYLPIHHAIQPNPVSERAVYFCIKNGANANGYIRLVGQTPRNSVEEMYGSAGLSNLDAWEMQNGNTEVFRGALHWACSNGSRGMVSILLQDGEADISARDSQGMTPLHHACISGSISCVKYLVNHGCDINAEYQGEDGKRYTALTLAKRKKGSWMPNILRRHGAVEAAN